MTSVVLVIHLMITIALVGIILVQKSEAGAFGDGGANPFMNPRARGDILTRTTGILATGFICTSILLGILTGINRQGAGSLLDAPVPASQAPAGVPALPATPVVPAPPAPGESAPK